MKATDLLKKDHRQVKKLFTAFGRTTSRATKTRHELARKITHELTVHSTLEEELFYPAVRNLPEGAALVGEAAREHGDVKELIAEIEEAGPKDVADKITELKKMVLHHVAEEEGAMFRVARELGAEGLARLGEQMAERKRTLQREGKGAARRGLRRAA